MDQGTGHTGIGIWWVPSSPSPVCRGRYTEPHVAGESPGSPQVVPGNPQGVQGVPEESLRSPPRTPWGSVLI